jgi:hypothetical protein
MFVSRALEVAMHRASENAWSPRRESSITPVRISGGKHLSVRIRRDSS